MKSRVVRTAFAASAVLGTLVGCGSEPNPECVIGRGNWIAKYYLKTGQTVSGACVNDWAPQAPPLNPYTAFPPHRQGEVLGLQKFGPPGSPVLRTMGIFPDQFSENALGSASPPPANLVSIGTFTSNTADSNHLCTVQNFSSITLSGITYQFSNVKFYVTAAHLGVQMTADLAYTNGGCTANYSVVGLSPEVNCDADIDCDPIQPRGGAFGSGISPDFPIKCDFTLPDPDYNCSSGDASGNCTSGSGPGPGTWVNGTCFLTPGTPAAGIPELNPGSLP